MHLDAWTVFLQTVNFAVLVWLLHRFLYRPVLQVIDRRQDEVRRQFDEAKALQDTARAHLADLDALRANITAERESAIKTAVAQTEEAMQVRRAQASRDAQALLDEARKTAAAEREALTREARRLALDLGADLARRLQAEVPPTLRAAAWLERIEQELNRLPAAEIASLRAQVSGNHALRVVTALPLAAVEAEEWRNRLARALAATPAVEFEVDPSLIAGAELHLPLTVLSFSLKSVLAVLSAVSDEHVDAG